MPRDIDPTPAALLAARYGDAADGARIRWNAVVEALLSHRSVRAYRPDALPDSSSRRGTAAIMLPPSWFGHPTGRP